MTLSNEQKAVVTADEILTDLLTEIADLDFMIKNGTFERFDNAKFWSAEIDKRKLRLERQLELAEIKMVGVSWPSNLKETFNLAKKRQAATKGRLTKVQKKLSI